MNVLDAGACLLDPSSRRDSFQEALILPAVRQVDCWLAIPCAEIVLLKAMLPPQGQLTFNDG